MKFSAIKYINIYKILQNIEVIIYLYFYKILKIDKITKNIEVYCIQYWNYTN